MATRRKKGNDGSESDDEDTKTTTNQNTTKKTSGGLNWAALGILIMMVLPAVLTGSIYLMDYLYPEAAKLRQFRDRLVKCYDVANPAKLSDIDSIVEKAKDDRARQSVLAKLRNKYSKFSSCH